MPVAVVIPVLDEAQGIESLLASLAQAPGQMPRQCVVVDGGSQDDTVERARAAGAHVIHAPRGRASQMNAGARACGDQWSAMLFLHADTRLPPGWQVTLGEAIAAGAAWGRFDVRLDSPRPMLRVVETMMNWRSRLTGICTGDQAIFVTRQAWQAVNGYAPIALMEDIDLSARLKRHAGRPAALRARVLVSARRWERHGVVRTIVLMWWYRLRFFLGESPQRLHRAYYRRR